MYFEYDLMFHYLLASLRRARTAQTTWRHQVLSSSILFWTGRAQVIEFCCSTVMTLLRLLILLISYLCYLCYLSYLWYFVPSWWRRLWPAFPCRYALRPSSPVYGWWYYFMIYREKPLDKWFRSFPRLQMMLSTFSWIWKFVCKLLSCLVCLNYLVCLEYLVTVPFQVAVWPADRQGNECPWYWLSACYRQLFPVPALCQCQARQVCNGQGSDRCRWVNGQTFWPCRRTQDARRSRTAEARFQRLDFVRFVQGTAFNGSSCSEKHQSDHRGWPVGADYCVNASSSLP